MTHDEHIRQLERRVVEAAEAWTSTPQPVILVGGIPPLLTRQEAELCDAVAAYRKARRAAGASA